MEWMKILLTFISITQTILIAFELVNYNTKKPLDRFFVTIMSLMFVVVCIGNLAQ